MLHSKIWPPDGKLFHIVPLTSIKRCNPLFFFFGLCVSRSRLLLRKSVATQHSVMFGIFGKKRHCHSCWGIWHIFIHSRSYTSVYMTSACTASLLSGIKSQWISTSCPVQMLFILYFTPAAKIRLPCVQSRGTRAVYIYLYKKGVRNQIFSTGLTP